MLDQLLKDFVPLDIKKLRPDSFYKDFLEAKTIDAERITKGSGWRPIDACPICGSADRELEFTAFKIGVVKCRACTHRYTDQIPVNLDEVYDSQEYEAAVKALELKQKDYRMKRFGQERAELIKGLFPDTDRTVLELGSGWGYLLHFLREAGFTCHGIELSKAMAEFSIKEFGLDIASTPVEQYRPAVRFDAIIMFGVIEHLPKPAEILSHCRRLLKDKGYVVMFTPNFESVAVKNQKQDANMVYPGQHLHHFTRASMEKAAELAGLTLYSFRTNGLDVGDLYSYYIHKKQPDVAAFLLANSEILQSVIDKAGCANHMRVILQK